MKVTLIIPAKNEEECIGHVVEDVPRDVVDEIIVVDGHSTDRTVAIAEDKGAIVITQPGMGYGDAIATGIMNATGDIITMIDADGSYETSDIQKLIKIVRDEGYDIAYGSRYLPESGSDDDTWIRLLGNKFFTFLLNTLHGVKISDSLFFYAAAKKEVFESLKMESKQFEYCIEFPIRAHYAGYTYKEIPSFEKERIAGDSKVNAALDGLKILWVMLKLKFSKKEDVQVKKQSTRSMATSDMN